MEINSFRNLSNEKLVKDKGKNNPSKEDDFEVEKINTIFTTEKPETEREKFNNTFNETNIDDENSLQGKMFLEGLNKNKADLMKDLGLSDNEYDSLACVAMALASQETGMGLEKGYISENTNINGVFRKILKETLSKIGGSSASSGLTQIKIYDFMKNEENRTLLEKYGVEAPSAGKSNLFFEPDKAAVASMVYLTKTTKEFLPMYEDSMKEYHEKVRGSLDSSLTDEQCLNKGKEILNAIKTVFNQQDTEGKEGIRAALTGWLLSEDNTEASERKFNKKDPGMHDLDYCEGDKFRMLYSHLATNGVKLEANDINYVRYLMTTDDYKFDSVESCAYAWHYGVYGGLAPDRYIAEKLGTMFTVPNNVSDSYYTDNVKYLTGKYANQSGSNLDETINFIDNYINNN